jgi:uncharacterized membrane protein YqjE
MNAEVILLMIALIFWMGICAWCGYGLRVMRFLAVLVAGFALYTLWILVVFNATPLEPNALMALVALLLYGVGAFGCGYLVGRLVRQFRASRVEG